MAILRNAGLAMLVLLGAGAPALHADAAEAAAGHEAHAPAEGRGPASPALGAAFAPNGTLWTASLDPQGRLVVQTSADAGVHWTPPRPLDTGDDAIAAEGESRPALAFGPRGQVVIVYTQPLSRPYTGNIRLLRSTDGGRSFARPVTVHGDRQEITHRFASVAFDRKGELFVVWVDKRDATKAAGDYAGAAIYGKRSKDGGEHFGPDLKLADHSCECCRIALAEQPSTGVVAMWRHVFEGSVRDHALLPLRDLGRHRKPARATHDGGVLTACPHHGPGLAAADDGGFHAVWYGFRSDGSSVQYGHLDARGRLLGSARELPDPGAEHADVIAAGSRVLVTWRSFDGERTRLRAWVSGDAGAQFTLRELSSSTGPNDHPRALRRGDALYVVWRQRNAIEVHRVD